MWNLPAAAVTIYKARVQAVTTSPCPFIYQAPITRDNNSGMPIILARR